MVQRFQERKTYFAERSELVTEMPTIVTLPEPDYKFGKDYTLIFESSGNETILKEGNNKHNSGIVQVEVKYDWYNNQPLRISLTNFSSIPQYFNLKYRFENNINAE